MKRFLSLFLLLFFLAGCGSSVSYIAPVTPAPSAASAGRYRLSLLLPDRPEVLSAIDALGNEGSETIYGSIAFWSDDQPDLTGTTRQAADAVASLLEMPGLGVNAIWVVTSSLEPLNAQAFLIGLEATERTADPEAEQRADDALIALTAPLQPAALDAAVAKSLVDLESLSELHGLRILDPAQLPQRKREAVRQARLTVPAPNLGDTVQKIIKLADLESYLDGSFSPTVGGAVTVYSQVEFLRTPQQLISGLRLDYPGGFQGQTRVGALLFALPADFQLKIPFAPTLGGGADPNLLYPFTGTGFTAYVQGRLVPELSIDSPTRLPLPAGAQLVEIDEAGQRILRATLKADGTWLPGEVSLRALPARTWLALRRVTPYYQQQAAA